MHLDGPGERSIRERRKELVSRRRQGRGQEPVELRAALRRASFEGSGYAFSIQTITSCIMA